MTSISSWDLLKNILIGAKAAWPLFALLGIAVIVKTTYRLIEKQ